MDNKLSKKDNFTNFIAKTAKALSWTEDKIKEELRKTFGIYDPNNEAQYTRHLNLLKDEEFQNNAEEKERRRKMANEQYGPEKCPICGAPTKPDLDWYNKYSKVPGWTCKAIGIRHFLWWRANNIRRYRGEPLAFPELYPVEEQA